MKKYKLILILFSISILSCPTPSDEKQLSTISFNDGNSVLRLLGSGTYTNIIQETGDGELSFSSSQTSVATVDSQNGAVTLLAEGTTVITAKKAETSEFLPIEESYTLTVLPEQRYNITINMQNQEGTESVTADALTACAGDTVILSAVLNAGRQVELESTAVTFTDNIIDESGQSISFQMPSGDVQINASFTIIPPKYNITIINYQNKTGEEIKSDIGSAAAGTEIEVDTVFELGRKLTIDSDDDCLCSRIMSNPDERILFIMPACDIEITATFSDLRIRDIGPAGGYIFYIDKNDEYADWDYLEVAPLNWEGDDDNSDIKLSWGGYDEYCLKDLNDSGHGLGNGKENTEELIKHEHTEHSSSHRYHEAARYVYYANGVSGERRSVNGFSDWYLPSLEELYEVYDALFSSPFSSNRIGGFKITSPYLSSTEANPISGMLSQAIALSFEKGPLPDVPYSVHVVSKSREYYIRPIREF